MKEELRIGTWKVLTLYEWGAIKQLQTALQDYKIDIIAL
jgi:hypothetical protein